MYNEKVYLLLSLTITDSSGRSNLYWKTIEITDKVVEKGDHINMDFLHYLAVSFNSAALFSWWKTVYINATTTYYMLAMM